PLALADPENPSDHDRTAISRTWELSLNALTDAGQPQARTLLWLLSCYAPTTPIPMALLNPQRLAELSVLGSGLESSPESIAAQRVLRDDLHGLAAVRLTELVAGQEPAVIMHPVVADASRSRLLTTAGSELSRIAEAAVGLLKTAAGTIDHQHPADWPVCHQLTPHVTALLEWLGGHLNPPDLETLVAISVRTAKAERRSQRSPRTPAAACAARVHGLRGQPDQQNGACPRPTRTGLPRPPRRGRRVPARCAPPPRPPQIGRHLREQQSARCREQQRSHCRWPSQRDLDRHACTEGRANHVTAVNTHLGQQVEHVAWV
ncbi:MAG TPA: hypothetical protein VJ371_18980, partial [Streptosporangiaceae bacterium]|nr:hypothetical protein [Streptosporangiaceae bacterium]